LSAGVAGKNKTPELGEAWGVVGMYKIIRDDKEIIDQGGCVKQNLI